MVQPSDIDPRKRDMEGHRETNHEVKTESDALARLNKLSSRLWQKSNLHEGLHEMLTATIELLGADMGNVQLLDADGRVLTIEAHKGFKKEFLDFFREVSTEDDCACGRALRSGERIVIEDVETDAPYAPFRGIAQSAGYRAVQSTPLIGHDGRPLGMLSTHFRSVHRPTEQDLHRLDLYMRQATDFIERCRTDETLRARDREAQRAREYAEAILRTSPVPLLVLESDCRVVTGNNAFYQTFKVSPRETEGRVVYELGRGQWNIPKLRELLEDILPHHSRFTDFEITHDFESIGPRTMLLNARRMENPPDSTERIVLVIEDITDRKQTEERLKLFNVELERKVTERTRSLLESEECLRALATELNLAEQRERKRLATELHDHLQQMLVLGKLKLGQGLRLIQANPAWQRMVKETNDILTDALTYTRTLAAELSPPVLRDHGLVAGLKWLADDMKKHDLVVALTVPDEEGVKLPEDQVVLLFQFVRELLINASKHAGTGRADVVLEERDTHLQITVHDEGAGFDLAAAAAAAAAGTPTGGISSKFGLFSVRERMKALGGSFEIQSTVGLGTTATLILPLTGKPASDESRATGNGSRTRIKEETAKLDAASDRRSLVAHRASPSKVRVLLADDHAMVRQGLRSVLDTYDDVEIVGEAADGEEMVNVIGLLRPAVVIMDINMPKMNGLEATAEIKAQHPDVQVIGLSVNACEENQMAMLRAGASVLLTKEAAVEELHDAIRQVMKISCANAGHPI